MVSRKKRPLESKSSGLQEVNPMKNIIKVISALPGLLTITPASSIQITDAEIQLRVRFSDEYKEYLRKFGAIIADGIELSGITNAEYRNVVSLTQKEWKLNPQVPHTMYIIEDTHMDGIMIWQDTQGYIYHSTPASAPIKIANSLSEYVSNRLV